MKEKCLYCLDTGCEYCAPKDTTVSESPSVTGSEALAEATYKFVSYALSCRQKNTKDWMEGLAIHANLFCEAFETPSRYRFDGEEIVPRPEP